MSKADDADRDERLKKIDHENAVYLKRLEFDYASRRDALAYTKEYGLFTLKSCLILNGGAILAMLTFIGNLYGREISTHTLKIHDFNCALMIFTLGLGLTIIASICGYFNFYASQKRLRQSISPPPGYLEIVTRTIAPYAAIVSLICFVCGVVSVVHAISPY